MKSSVAEYIIYLSTQRTKREGGLGDIGGSEGDHSVSQKGAESSSMYVIVQLLLVPSQQVLKLSIYNWIGFFEVLLGRWKETEKRKV